MNLGNAKENRLFVMNNEKKYFATANDINPEVENNSLSYIIKAITDNSTVLDVGCSYGYLGEWLNKNKNCQMYGIDIDKEAVEYVKKSGYYKDVFHLDLDFPEKTKEEFERMEKLKEIFDFVICADILEHLKNPTEALEFVISKLKLGGQVLISIPNIAHMDIILNLLESKFNYSEFGILDNTHLRFFTKSSFVEWINSANELYKSKGFKLDVKYLGGTKYVSEFLEKVKNNHAELYNKILDANKELETLQHIFVLTKVNNFANTYGLNDLLNNTNYANPFYNIFKEKSTLEQKMKDLTLEITSLKKKFDEDIANKEQLIWSFKKEIEKKEAEVQTLKESIDNNYQVIESLEKSLREKEEKLNELFFKIEEKEMEVNQLKEIMNNNSETVRNLEEILIKKEKELNYISNTIKEKENEIENMKEVIKNKDYYLKDVENKYNDVNSKLEHIYNSHGWKFLLKYYRIRDIILPEGSKRRKLIKYFFKIFIMFYINLRKSINFIRLFGFKTFLKKVRIKLINSNIEDKNYDIQENVIKQINIDKKVRKHNESVDIIICVHNAYEDIKKCLESVLINTSLPYSIIIIDDGSDKQTKDFLRDFAKINKAFLIRNDVAKGYTFAANQGLRKSKSKYVVLLNSDTIVTNEWIDRMIQCAESSNNIGIVGPLSNTASWQSIPEITENGDWAKNTLPENISIKEMGKLISEYSGRIYPRLPFLNGFCLLIKRELIEKIGYFDEKTFGKGYGEENDYCIRALKAGWDLAIADDVYIYHAQSKSYSNEKRKLLCEAADKALIKKHGIDIIANGVQRCKDSRVLQGIRTRVKVMFERELLISKAKEKYEGKRILFILPVASAGGGANVVIDECKALIKMGIDARIMNLKEYKEGFERSYPYIDIPIIFGDKEDIPIISNNFDIVVATANRTVEWIKPIVNKNIQKAYYIQDFEPYFYEKDSNEYRIAWESYNLIPEIKRITKTKWNNEELKRNLNLNCDIIGPSVNIDLFRPRIDNTSDYINICAMIRPSTPYRNPKMTMEILKEIYNNNSNKIRIVIFGCSNHDLIVHGLNYDFPYINAGILNQEQVAGLMCNMDIFVDFSLFQAMGLTALEAMAAGVAVIVPARGGANSFAVDRINSLIVDTSSKRKCVDALNELIFDDKLRNKLRSQAIVDACKYYPERAAYNMLEVFFNK